MKCLHDTYYSKENRQTSANTFLIKRIRLIMETVLEKKQQSSQKSNTSYILMITLVAALGGLLFGYDTAVISGAVGSLRIHFNLSDAQLGWAASSALVGCIIGAGITGVLANKYGRKKILLLAAILFAISAVGSAIPDSLNEFIVYRIVGGLGVGIASMLSPMYIAEIAPSHIRGRLVSLNQFTIIFGMLVVYFVNYYIAIQGDDTWNVSTGWRYMFASETIPALLFFGLLFVVPESPRWLYLKGKKDEAKKILGKIVDEKELDNQLNAIDTSINSEKNIEKVSLLGKSILPIVLIGMALSAFQQVTGINVFLYYAPEIFKSLGGGSTDTAMLQTIVVGAVNLTFTVVAMYTVDKWGRKPLMLVGSLGMGICISAIGVAAYMQSTDGFLLIFVLGYIACFALSLGPIVWVLLSEIFPNNIRDKGLSVAVAAQWISNFLVSQTFPMMMGNETLINKFHGGFPFWVYGFMCLVTIIFVWKFIPETKGKSLEDLEKIWVDKYGK